MSILHIKFCYVPVGAELDPGQSERSSSHLFADDSVIDILAAFDDQFIVNMPADKAEGQGPHGVAEDIPADPLDYILYILSS